MEKIIAFVLFICIAVGAGGCNKKEGPSGPSNPPKDILNIIEHTPRSEATNISINTTISLVFDQDLNYPENESIDLILVVRVTAANRNINGEFRYIPAEKKIVFTPDSPLTPTQTYKVTVTTGIKSVSGKKLNKDYVFAFTTAEEEVLEPLDIFDHKPPDLETEVTIADFKVEIEFNQNVDSAISIKLKKNGEGEPELLGDSEYNESKATFIPAESLASNTSYQVSVEGKDKLGNDFSRKWVFTTEDNNTPFSVVQTEPASGTKFVGTGASIRIRFNKKMDVASFKKQDGTSENIILKKQSDSSIVVARVEYDEDKKEVILVPASLSGDTKYVVSVDRTVKTEKGSILENLFEMSFDTGSISESFKVRDNSPIFDPEEPTSISVSDPQIWVNFNREVDKSSIKADTFIVKEKKEDGTGGTVPGEYQFDLTGKKVSFLLSGENILKPGTKYIVALTSGINEKGLAESKLSPWEWEFTTAETIRPASVSVTGKLVSSAYSAEDWSKSLLVVENADTKQIDLIAPASDGGFSLNLPTDKTFLLSLINKNFHYEASLILNNDNKSNLIMGLKAAEPKDLGEIELDEVQHILSLKVPLSINDLNLNAEFYARAVEGVPVGAGNYGKGEGAKKGAADLSVKSPDRDFDGIPDIFDADNDGNGFVDEFDSVAVHNEGLGNNDFIEQIKLTQEMVFDSPPPENITPSQRAGKKIIKFEFVPKTLEMANLIEKIELVQAPDYYSEGIIYFGEGYEDYQFSQDINDPETYPYSPSYDRPWIWHNYRLFKGILLSGGAPRWVAWVKFDETFSPGNIFKFQVKFKESSAVQEFIKMVNFTIDDIPRIIPSIVSGHTGDISDPIMIENNAPILTWLRPKDEGGNEIKKFKYDLFVSYYNNSDNIESGALYTSGKIIADSGAENIGSGKIFIDKNLPKEIQKMGVSIAIKKYSVDITGLSAAGDKVSLKKTFLAVNP